MAALAGDAYQCEGDLSVDQANRVLLRLVKEDIRFQIETEAGSPGDRDAAAAGEARVRLSIHAADLEAWRKIRLEFFPA
jgi:hypothetical protein